MRPKHPHAAESGVGKHTARESERVQACAAGKERVTNAHPHKLAPEASRLPEPFCFSAIGRERRWQRDTGTAGVPPALRRDSAPFSHSGPEAHSPDTANVGLVVVHADQWTSATQPCRSDAPNS